MPNSAENSLDKTHQSKTTALPPADPLGQKFCHWFNSGYNHIYLQEGKWSTEIGYPLQPRNLWSKYVDPDTVLGLRFGSQTNYLVIDIDRQSQYHPLNDADQYKRIPYALEEALGLND